MTTWVPDDLQPGMTLNRPGEMFDDPDTCTLEQYRRWQAELPSFDDPPGRGLPQTIRVRDDIL